jgi:hypothetical protein
VTVGGVVGVIFLVWVCHVRHVVLASGAVSMIKLDHLILIAVHAVKELG